MPLARKAISFLSDSFVSIRITVFEAFLQRGWYRREIFCQQDILIQNQIFLDGFRPTQASLKGSKFLRLSGRNLRDSRYEHFSIELSLLFVIGFPVSSVPPMCAFITHPSFFPKNLIRSSSRTSSNSRALSIFRAYVLYGGRLAQ